MVSWVYTENKDASIWNVNWDAEEHSYYMSDSNTNQGCDHAWVNVSFNHVRLACKYCGVDKEN